MFEKIKKMITKQKEDDNIELEEMKSDNDTQQVLEEDLTYIQYSAEAVGYENRENQWNVYKTIMQYIPEDVSVLDYGCGRGDLQAFHLSEYNKELNYYGVDFNEPLINAGKEIYPDIEEKLLLSDWFKLPKNLAPRDWCVNIASSNLRYDADMKKDDFKYLQDTITSMYDNATQGVVLLLSSRMTAEGLVNHDPGRIFNWVQKKYQSVVLDHTVSKSGFCLIIYK
jgi:SAM-dependent methyltransferase